MRSRIIKLADFYGFFLVCKKYLHKDICQVQIDRQICKNKKLDPEIKKGYKEGLYYEDGFPLQSPFIVSVFLSLLIRQIENNLIAKNNYLFYTFNLNLDERLSVGRLRKKFADITPVDS